MASINRRGFFTAAAGAMAATQFGMSIPVGAAHASAARRFLEFLWMPDVLRQLRAAHVDMLDHPIVVGEGAPSELTRGARR